MIEEKYIEAFEGVEQMAWDQENHDSVALVLFFSELLGEGDFEKNK
jgi:hypothetical protein